MLMHLRELYKSLTRTPCFLTITLPHNTKKLNLETLQAGIEWLNDI
jgi:hypothetical protein